MSIRKIVSEKIAFQSKYFQVKRIEIQKDGITLTKDLIERNPTVLILPFTDDNDLYLEKQYRDAFGKTILEVVAGTMEYGGDPLGTAKRELEEETGLTARDWKQIAEYEMSVNTRSKIYIFVARGLTEGKAHLDDDEEIEVVKIPFHEVVEKVYKGEIIAANQVSAILLAKGLMEKKEL